MGNVRVAQTKINGDTGVKAVRLWALAGVCGEWQKSINDEPMAFRTF